MNHTIPHTARPLTRALVTIVTLTALALAACDANNTKTPTPAKEDPTLPTKRAILASVGENVVLPALGDFVTRATTLREATEAWSQAPDDMMKQEAARVAWRDAMVSWQVAEVLQLGPAGPMATVIGGADLRDDIYSWPLNNTCRVYVELVNQTYLDATAFATARVNVRGLDALEVLLFHEGEENSCSTQHLINTEGSWGAITGELTARRAVYAKAAAAQLVTAAEELERRWRPDGGDFLKELTSAGQGSATYASVQEALNAVSDAMFYLEKETKDMKLGEPTGLVGCTTGCVADPAKQESTLGDHSRANILANLRGFELMYYGGDPQVKPDAKGFDDLLRELNEEALAQQLEGEIVAARGAVEAIPGEMDSALRDNPGAVEEAFRKVKTLTDRVKVEFITALDLDLPQRAAGDND